MKKVLSLVATLSMTVLLCAYNSTEDVPKPVTSTDSNETKVLLDCDTIIIMGGYTFHIIRDNGEEVFSGIKLFHDDMKKAMDKALLERIESDLYKLAIPSKDSKGVLTKIVKGEISDFKSISTDTPCSVSSTNSKYMMAEWDVNGKKLIVEIPISYETAKGSDRSRTENSMINRIKKSDGNRNNLAIDKDNLESYGEDLFLLPGGTYYSKDITQNTYFDSSLRPIWNTNHALESITDLFLFPSDIYGDVEVALTILKHEYGEKETITTTVNKMLAEFEKDGCVPFWGVEKLADGKLEGALFLYNQKQGYDHVLKIECNPEDIISGKGYIKARVSLFIPTNNVENLYSPYVKKSKNERIDYEKK